MTLRLNRREMVEPVEEERTVFLLHNIEGSTEGSLQHLAQQGTLHLAQQHTKVERQISNISAVTITTTTSRQTSASSTQRSALEAEARERARTLGRQRTQSHLLDTDSSLRASVTITYITIAFILSYGPYMIIWIHELVTRDLRIFRPLEGYLNQAQSVVFMRHFSYVYLVSTNLLSTFNSTAFPVIYFVRVKGRQVRELVTVVRVRAEGWVDKIQAGGSSFMMASPAEVKNSISV